MPELGGEIMRCTLQMLLKQPLFKDAKVLAGEKALDNVILRSSVFDCPLKDSMLANNILSEGDLFISGLDQFKDDPQRFMDYINVLIDHQCCGLIITDENIHLLTPEIRAYCSRCALPVISVERNISYADMINTINGLVVSQYYHALNDEKISKLLAKGISSTEKLKMLNSINPLFAPFMAVISVQGIYRSTMTDNELFSYFASRSGDYFILHDNICHFLFSAEQQPTLKKTIQAFLSLLKNYFSSYSAGVSTIRQKSEIGKLLSESSLAMNTAKSCGKTTVFYDAGSLPQLLTKIKEDDELYNFYQHFCHLLEEYKTENSSTLLDTLRYYVQCGGSFHLTAEKTGQNEATIRYRISRIRQLLGLEEDIVTFHAISAILITIDGLISKQR